MPHQSVPRSVDAAGRRAPATPTNAVARLAGTAGACAGAATGVTVAVDFKAFGGGERHGALRPGKPATGVAALQGAGFTPAGTAQYGLAFVCRINNLPRPAQQPCISTPADHRLLGVLPREQGGQDVDVQRDGRVVVQAGSGEHRGLGVRQRRQAEPDPGPGARDPQLRLRVRPRRPARRLAGRPRPGGVAPARPRARRGPARPGRRRPRCRGTSRPGRRTRRRSSRAARR